MMKGSPAGCAHWPLCCPTTTVTPEPPDVAVEGGMKGSGALQLGAP